MVLLIISTAFVIVYKKLEGNIHALPLNLGTHRPDKPKVIGPQQPLNVLVLGSDNREGENVPGASLPSGARSDTTLIRRSMKAMPSNA